MGGIPNLVGTKGESTSGRFANRCMGLLVRDVRDYFAAWKPSRPAVMREITRNVDAVQFPEKITDKRKDANLGRANKSGREGTEKKKQGLGKGQ